jgi:hypothetical protein
MFNCDMLNVQISGSVTILRSYELQVPINPNTIPNSLTRDNLMRSFRVCALNSMWMTK